MIYIFTGKTGSGKTFQMVKLAFKHWLSGVDIYSNTILKFVEFGGQSGCNILDNPEHFTLTERILEWPKYYLSRLFKYKYKPTARGRIIYFEDITEVLEVKNGIILFDEAQVILNARNWEKLPDEFSYKLQQHRKHRLDLYATAQNMGTVEINYRRLVQKWVHCERIFGLNIKGSEIFTIFQKKIKDIDYLYNSVDDLQVPDIKKHIFIIHKFKKRLYDTFYDIGFKRFQTVWLTNFNENMKKTQTFLIVPKKMSLRDALRDIRLYNSLLEPVKSRNSYKN